MSASSLTTSFAPSRHGLHVAFDPDRMQEARAEQWEWEEAQTEEALPTASAGDEGPRLATLEAQMAIVLKAMAHQQQIIDTLIEALKDDEEEERA